MISALQHREKKDFNDELHTWTWLVAFAVTALVIVLLPYLIPTLVGEKPEHTQLMFVKACISLAPLAGMGLIIGFYATILLAQERHTNTLTEAVPPLFVLVVVIYFSANQSLTALTVSTLLGVAAQMIILHFLLKKGNINPGFSTRVQSRAWKRFVHVVGALAISQLVISLSLPIDQFLAARLDTGSLSTLGYCNRILALVLSLGSTTVSRAILPVLSDPNMEQKRRIDVTLRWAGTMMLCGFIGILIGWYLSSDLVRLLFERGAFTASDTIAVSEAVRYGLIQMPCFFAGIVIVQFFASIQHYRPIVISGVVAIAVKTIAGIYLSGIYDLKGVLISTALMTMATAIYLYWETTRLNRLVPASRG